MCAAWHFFHYISFFACAAQKIMVPVINIRWNSNFYPGFCISCKCFWNRVPFARVFISFLIFCSAKLNRVSLREQVVVVIFPISLQMLPPFSVLTISLVMLFVCASRKRATLQNVKVILSRKGKPDLINLKMGWKKWNRIDF